MSTEEEEQEEGEKVKRFTRLIEEEVTHAVCQEQAALNVVIEAVAKLRQAATKPNEAEEVLQTRIVSQQEVRKKAKGWGPAIMSELTSLFEKEGALQKDISERRKDDDSRRESRSSSRQGGLLYTIKPVPGSPQGKLKVRIVACGNFSQEDPQMEVFASGTNWSLSGLVLLRKS